ncbi:MAG: thymidine phosphorylase [Planctomycetota bacterium]
MRVGNGMLGFVGMSESVVKERSEPMIPAVVIAKKRDRGSLSSEEIDFMISGYAKGEIPDYQMAAMAMAIYIQGMDSREIADLTDAMIRSGNRLKRVSDRPRVDKHSTGGLGDKTSLILAPLLACCDLDVPMISGRGLGITGGTLDKLEAIPGFRCNLTEEESEHQLRRLGCFITGTTEGLVPADKKLYALRDVTGTVPSIALITSSIMSKKIAETLDALVLDVKCGSGAFLGTDEQAEALAASLISNGERAGVKTVALITDMDQPLGEMVGNALEVKESIDVLEGRGPKPVRDLTIELGARLVHTLDRTLSLGDARLRLSQVLDSGQARERFEAMVSSQGGEIGKPLRVGKNRPFLSPSHGKLLSIDGQKMGQAVIAMGGGRKIAGEAIDPSVGMRLRKRLGEEVGEGEELLQLHCDDDTKAEQAMALVSEAIRVGEGEWDGRALWRTYGS